MYHGENNSLSKERQLVTDWMCTFDMGWYPFGIQKCDMRFYVVEEDIKLVPKNITFNGNCQDDTYISLIKSSVVSLKNVKAL